MKPVRPVLLYEDEIIQAMPLTFQSGGHLMIILPKDISATGVLTTMTNEYFEKIIDDSIYATGELLLPRFSIESNEIKLAEALTVLGVPLFNASAAPLTGGIVDGDTPVWLTGAVQKAMIDVDEKGAVAAAVASFTLAGASVPTPTKPFVMKCNKPFVFVLYDHTYDGGNQVLFIGIVNKP